MKPNIRTHFPFPSTFRVPNEPSEDCGMLSNIVRSCLLSVTVYGFLTVPRSWENVMTIYNLIESLINGKARIRLSVVRCNSWELSA